MKSTDLESNKFVTVFDLPTQSSLGAQALRMVTQIFSDSVTIYLSSNIVATKEQIM